MPKRHDARTTGKVVRDPVHDYIEVPDVLAPLVSSGPVQRLRNIAQNSRAIAAYPSMNGSRYEHALGTMHFAREAWHWAWANAFESGGKGGSASRTRSRFIDNIYADVKSHRSELDAFTLRYAPQSGLDKDKAEEDFNDDFEDIISHCVGAVALLHDVGHPPFSHVMEGFYAKFADKILGPESRTSLTEYIDEVKKGEPQFHEWAGREILFSLPATTFDRVSLWIIKQVYTDRSGRGWAYCLHSIIDGQFDVDRLDYLIRDARRAGTGYDAIDSSRLLRSLELHVDKDGWHIGLGMRAVSAIETMLLLRAQSYRWVIHHESVTHADTALARCASEVFELTYLVQSDDGNVPALSTRLRELEPSLDYLSACSKSAQTGSQEGAVDDHSFLMWLRQARAILEEASSDDSLDQPIDQYITRILPLYKIFDDLNGHFVPAWRNYGEFLSRIRAAPHARALLRVAKIASQAELKDKSRRRLSGGESLEASRLVAKKRPALINRAIRDATNQGRLLLNLERYLNDSYAVLPQLGKGRWVLAERPFKAIKQEMAVVYDGNKPVMLSQLSPMIDMLSASEEMRPHWFVYFIPSENLLQPYHIPSSFGEQVANRFFEAVVNFAQEMVTV